MAEKDASKNVKTSEELANSQTGKEGTGKEGVARPGAPITAVGTDEEVATQGFTGVKVQADQQASPHAEGEDVPMGENPLKKSVFRDAEARKNTKEFTVEDNKFHFGGEVFKKGDKIHLLPEEYGRARTHLKEKNLKQDDGMRTMHDDDKKDDRR
jgi:hypothetical protein